MAHRSTERSSLSARFFFLACLEHQVAVGVHGTRHSQSEPGLPVEALALANSKINVDQAFDAAGECLAIPKVSRESDVFGPLPYGGRNGAHLSLSELATSARALSLGQAGVSLLLEPSDPVLDGPEEFPSIRLTSGT